MGYKNLSEMKKAVKNILFECSRLKSMSSNLDMNVKMTRVAKEMLEPLK